MNRERVVLQFPSETIDQPVTWQLVREFNLWLNILRAAIDPGREGRLLVEMAGEEPDLARARRFLLDLGVSVHPLGDKLEVDRDSCLDCGSCTAVCVPGALAMDADDRLTFAAENCVLCLACVDACPVGALSAAL